MLKYKQRINYLLLKTLKELMSFRKTTFSQYSTNVLKLDNEQDYSSAKTVKKSNYTITTDYNSLQSNLDSLDNLLDQQSSKKSRFFFSQKIDSEESARYIKTDSDLQQKEVKEVRPFRFRRKETQPKIDLNDKSDVDDFFTGVEIPRISQQAQKQNAYQLVSFTDYVENLYGKDWFQQRERKFKRQITVQDFFDTPC
ncbi:unnamed protein product (macronuclear) [Paramecium tetraurelia]|uniref:Uncharacterized protein n=1 Tax=Paramecium tetraurelia TaxID=5888 RepID=A0DRB2_PARTE|nr:uncharacterized protein GSPATT00019296001 [Paramecium tetraurelia]CAK85579.1 unnamed protein product [Paramecium tetraurelia]|eukprot:XP_001452976.1 hypothetical protein (macronuclear) [Paramecium tetraurelia strain d4-2]